MKKNRIGYITAAISAIFAAGIITFIGGIAYDRSQGPSKAQKHFNDLSHDVELLVNEYSVSSNDFATGFIKAAGDFQRYNKLILRTDYAEIYHFEAQSNSSEAITADFAATISARNGKRFYISAQIYTITPVMIYYRARLSFLLILAGTVAAILLILFINFEEAEPEASYFNDNSLSSYEEEEKESLKEAEQQFEKDSAENYEGTEEIRDEIITGEREESPAATEQSPSAQENDKVLPEWLLSQERLESDLEAELIHSASCAHDVSLLMFNFISSSPIDKDVSAQVIELIARKTQDRGYFYHYGDGYALIIQDASLDVAMELAEEIHTESQNILAACKNAHLIIGISARTERIIAAKRLLTEAEQALEHAAEDPSSPIIAFRVNPEKYRQYILNNEI